MDEPVDAGPAVDGGTVVLALMGALLTALALYVGALILSPGPLTS